MESNFNVNQLTDYTNRSLTEIINDELFESVKCPITCRTTAQL